LVFLSRFLLIISNKELALLDVGSLRSESHFIFIQWFLSSST
jgi:hypothetical protein